MRMWMVDPETMCRKHLLGEHVELHMFVGSIKRGVSMAGYLSGGLLEPASLWTRHDDLVTEMERRGYNHSSTLEPITLPDEWLGVMVDEVGSKEELHRRCPECRRLADDYDKSRDNPDPVK